MSITDEIANTMGEAEKPIATPYTLTNDSHAGVIRGTHGEALLTEPGIVPTDGIVIVDAVSNFTRPPDANARELVNVLTGPLAGEWVLVSVVVDNANYVMTCEASE